MKGLIFTYVLTYGGAACSLIEPHYGLLVYVAFAILKPESLWHWSMSGGGHFSRIVAVALLAGWALRRFGTWQFGRAKAVVGALIGFAAWSVISTVQAPYFDLAWIYVEEMLKILIPFLVGITTIDSVRKLKQLAWVVMLSQGYVAYDFNVSYYRGFNRVQEGGFAGLDNNCIAISMVSCVGLAFFLGLNAPKWWQQLAALASALLMAHVVMFSYSRGGMLALILTGLLAFVLIPKRPKHFAAFALAVLVGIRLAGPSVRERFLTSFADPAERDASAESRLQLWSDCWDTMLRYPIAGVGPNHWGLIAPEYGWPIGKQGHSLWLQVGAEMGVPALTVLALFYSLCATRLWPLARGRQHGVDPWLTDSARMVVSSLFGFMLSAQFVSLSGLEAPYYVALIGAGTLKLASLSSPVAAAAQDWNAQPWVVGAASNRP